MKLLRIVIWIGFLLCVVAMQLQVAKLMHASNYGIVAFEFAKQTHIENILTQWNTGNVLPIAKSNMAIDFVFIVFYVALVIMLSYRQMQREKWYVLNSLLRLNFLLIVLAGILDIIEDVFLLKNIHAFSTTHEYTSTYWVALIKFVIAGWAVFVWLISLIKSTVSK